MKKRSRPLIITLIVVFVIAVFAAGYEFYHPKSSDNSDQTTDVSAKDEIVDKLIDSTNQDFWNMTGDISEAQKKSSQIKKTGQSSILVNTPPASQSTSISSEIETPDNSQDNQKNDEDKDENISEPELKRMTLDDFENGSAKWKGDFTLFSPGYESQHAIKLTNSQNESTAVRRMIETPILGGFENLEFDINSQGQDFLPGDASAVAFEQDGEWKWVSLSNYAKNGFLSWQHITIPLENFTELDINSKVANLTFRFWNNKEASYLIDNIALSGQAERMAAPTNLSGNGISWNQISLSWNGEYKQYNIYKDNCWIASAETSTYSVKDLDPNTNYHFFVTGVKNSEESVPSDSITIKTQSFRPEGTIISDFEDETNDQWSGNSLLVPGMNSSFALRLVNEENDSTGTEKTIDNAVAAGHQNFEFDINLNGGYFDGPNAEITLDQDGWKTLSLLPYIENSKQGWQHVAIPLEAFDDFESNQAIAKIIFRFWNAKQQMVDIDNIAFN